MNKAAFFDRDGTINEEVNYLHKIEDFRFIPGVPDFIKSFNDKGYLVIIVTNQAGIARGFYTENDMHLLHDHINSELSKIGAHIDAFYFCPHHPIHGLGEYKRECNCRKPKTGMLDKAIAEWDIDPAQSFLFGDKHWDIEVGKKCGINSFYIDDALNTNIKDCMWI